MSTTNIFPIASVAVLAVIAVALFFVGGAVLTAWTYAKSPLTQYGGRTGG